MYMYVHIYQGCCLKIDSDECPGAEANNQIHSMLYIHTIVRMYVCTYRFAVTCMYICTRYTCMRACNVTAAASAARASVSS